MRAVNPKKKLDLVAKHWEPKVIGELNGQYVKVVKLLGEFVWHHHEDEDELFYVMKGNLLVQFRDREVMVEPGEMIIIPRGVEHKTFAEKEVHALLFEPISTVSTGNVRNEQTILPEQMENLSEA